MVYVKIREKIPVNGEPVEVSIREDSKAHSGDIKVSLEVFPSNEKFNQYDWNCSIRVFGGGLRERSKQDKLNFIAPESGYVESVEFNMMESMGNEWMSTTGRKNFYLRLADNTYARITIEIHSTSRRLMMESFYNPSGSRNLEYDPTKRISP